MAKHITVIQSTTTGRFLLKQEEGVWTFPHVVDVTADRALLFESLHECQNLTGQDGEELLMDWLSHPTHQLFFATISGEPLASQEGSWFALYDFPEPLSKIVVDICRFNAFLLKSSRPEY